MVPPDPVRRKSRQLTTERREKDGKLGWISFRIISILFEQVPLATDELCILTSSHRRFPIDYNLVSPLAWPCGYLSSVGARAGFFTEAQ